MTGLNGKTIYNFGNVEDTRQPEDEPYDIIEECPECNGSGLDEDDNDCENCEGTGEVYE